MYNDENGLGKATGKYGGGYQKVNTLKIGNV